MRLYNIIYSEVTEYDETLEADSPEQATNLFKAKLENDEIEPTECVINEFEVLPL